MTCRVFDDIKLSAALPLKLCLRTIFETKSTNNFMTMKKTSLFIRACFVVE